MLLENNTDLAYILARPYGRPRYNGFRNVFTKRPQNLSFGMQAIILINRGVAVFAMTFDQSA